MAVSTNPPRSGARRAGAIADIALLLVVILVPAVSFAIVKPPLHPQTTAPVGPPLPDLGLIQATCGPIADTEAKRDCYLDAMRPALITHGVAVTFAMLEDFSARDSFVSIENHQMAHSLGRDAFLLIGDAPRIIAECPTTMHSGCTHGTIEAYLSAQPITDKAVVPSLCAPVAEAAGTFGHHQCLHGLGHGLMMALGHDLWETLSYCDALTNDWHAGSCYDGTFMENIISYQIANGIILGEAAGAHVHEGAEPTHGILYAGNPHWPCNEADERYKARCYMMQTSVYLMFMGWDYRRAYLMCDEVPMDHRYICYQSMGRDISPGTRRDPAQTLAWCQWGDDALEDWCVVGAAKEYITDAGRVDPAWPLCRLAPEHIKTRCYQAIGEYLISLAPAPAQRWTECAKAEPNYVATCRTWARI